MIMYFKDTFYWKNIWHSSSKDCGYVHMVCSWLLCIFINSVEINSIYAMRLYLLWITNLTSDHDPLSIKYTYCL